MNAIQIFAAIFIVALIAGWVIIADACKNAPIQETEPDTTRMYDGEY